MKKHLNLDYAALTDVGKVREENEDTVSIARWEAIKAESSRAPWLRTAF